jgi:hypothetical protein
LAKIDGKKHLRSLFNQLCCVKNISHSSLLFLV